MGSFKSPDKASRDQTSHVTSVDCNGLVYWTKSILIHAVELMQDSLPLLPIQALELLPSAIEVREVYDFLLSILEDKESKRRKCQVLKSLLFAEHLQVMKV